ncbi:MAG: hypothetical protein ACU836_14965 [Gammaproteobacteria bacterium]
MQREPMKRTGDEMDLPKGLTCKDCIHFDRCHSIYGHIKTDEVCDWSPSRFRAKEILEAEEVNKEPIRRHEIKQHFQHWCIVELFGHVRLSGFVTEIEIAGKGFIKLDIHTGDIKDACTKILGSDAVYAITPVSEEAAKACARAHPHSPLTLFDEQKLIEQGVSDELERMGETAWTPLSERMPSQSDMSSVLVYLEGNEIHGEQFFIVRPDDLNESAFIDPADQPEECRFATHWKPLSFKEQIPF